MEDLIQNNKCTPTTATHYHVSSKTPFCLPDSKSQSEFLKLYLDSVRDGNTLAISEIYRDYIPLILRFRLLNMQCGVNIEEAQQWVLQVGERVQEIIMRNFKVSPSGAEYIFILQDDAKEEDENSDKQGPVIYNMTMYFPFFRIKKEREEKLKTTLISELDTRQETPAQFEIETLQSMNEIISIVKTEKIPMFGSPIKPSTPNILGAYEMTTLQGARPIDMESDIFDPRVHVNICPTGVVYDEDEDPEYYYPVFFTSGIPSTEDDPLPNSIFYGVDDLEDEEEGYPEELQNAFRYLSMIKKERFTNPADADDIGMALYSCSYGSEDGLEMWKSFCKDLTDDEDYFEERWDEYDNDPQIGRVTEMTLQYMAMKDSKDKYTAYRDTVMMQYIQACVNYGGEEQSLADAFYQCFPFALICSSFKGNVWYHYDKHSWAICDGILTIYQLIKTKFIGYFEKYRRDLIIQATSIGDNTHKLALEQQSESAMKIIKTLRTSFMKNKICRELGSTGYYRGDFEKTKDTITHLFGMKNGVIDLRGGKPIIREGRPEDYITMCAPTKWRANYHWNHPHVKMTMEYFYQVFPNEDVREWMLLFIASRLQKGNPDKIYPFWTGSGNNSKTVMVSFLEKTFGLLSGPAARGLMSRQKNDSNGATPALINTMGKNMIFSQEPNPNEPFESSIVKALTGNDSMYLRDLYKGGTECIEWKPTWVPILIANTIPHMPDLQEAVWNRIRVIPFESRFTKDPESYVAKNPEMKGKVFPIDKNFDKKIPKMTNALLWIVVMYYEKYAEEGLPEPDIVMSATEVYRRSNNYIEQFVHEVCSEGDETDLVSDDDLCQSFTEWFKKQNLPHRSPTRKEIIKGLEDVLGKNSHVDGYWSGTILLGGHNE